MSKHIILQGDAWQLAKMLPSQSVNCIVTSPPYWSLRDYGTATWEGGDPACDHRQSSGGTRNNGRNREASGGTFHDSPRIEPALGTPYRDLCGKCGARRIDSQFGLERTPGEYVARLVELFRELRRALRDDGVLWLNLGDSYAGSGGAGDWTKRKAGKGEYAGPRGNANRLNGEHGLKPKDMAGIPWRCAFALQEDGWWLRSDIIWHKPNPMPESVTDRPTKSHEYIFLFSKSERYFYDAEAVREDGPTYTRKAGGYLNKGSGIGEGTGGIDGRRGLGFRDGDVTTVGRQRRTVWTVPTRPYGEAHFATFPEALITPCVLAGSSEVGNCPECGNPWVRVVEHANDGTRRAGNDRAIAMGHSPNGMTAMARAGEARTSTTTGWRPTCKHEHDPVPAVVLDPFMGAGTTAVVALAHGRDAVGFELNPDYIELAEKRIREVTLERPLELPALERQLIDLPLFARGE